MVAPVHRGLWVLTLAACAGPPVSFDAALDVGTFDAASPVDAYALDTAPPFDATPRSDAFDTAPPVDARTPIDARALDTAPTSDAGTDVGGRDASTTPSDAGATPGLPSVTLGCGIDWHHSLPTGVPPVCVDVDLGSEWGPAVYEWSPGPDIRFRWRAPRAASYQIYTPRETARFTSMYVANPCGAAIAPVRFTGSGYPIALTRGQEIDIVVTDLGTFPTYISILEGPAEEVDCNDLKDSDLDGVDDTVDPSCMPLPAEASCSDGIDQDLDGHTDCRDLDCTSSGACGPELCANGIDDNADGIVDCEDYASCGMFPSCDETSCGDGVDNDMDGLLDCAEFQCRRPIDSACMEEFSCGNGLDDDGDGRTDCDDSECTCPRTTCVIADLGDAVGEVVASFPAAGFTWEHHITLPCDQFPWRTQPEAHHYAWRAPAAGHYRIETQAGDPTRRFTDTVLGVLDGCCDGPVLACSDDVRDSLFSEVEIDAVAGQQLVLVVTQRQNVGPSSYRLVVTRTGP